MSPENRSPWRAAGELAAFLAVGFLFYHMSWGKFMTLRQASHFDPKDDTALFWTENAFHYRYAKMAALGPGIPDVDPKMQYPEGMHVTRDETPMMERLAGLLYRRFTERHLPFHVFLVFLACFYSSAVLFPAFFLSGHAWKGLWPGLITSLFYVFTYSFIGGVVLGSYVRQDFVLPFLFMATFLLLAALDTGGRAAAASAAALFAFSFMSWHLSPFYYLVLVAGLVALYLAEPAARGRIASALLIVTVVLFAASFLSPPLRSGRFPLSWVMLLSYALLGQHYVFRGREVAAWRRLLFLAAGLVALGGGAAWISQGHFARYSHVYRLVFDKIRCLGFKPEDPAGLCFESRVMWTSSFLSPSPGVMAGWLGGGWLAGAAGAWVAVRRMRAERRIAPSAFIILWMAAAFTVLFALIQRMDVFAGFFVCVLAGAAAPRRVFTARGAAASALLLALVAFNVWHLQRLYLVGSAPLPTQTRPLIGYLRERTAPDDVVLATFQFSPVICAFADRPVVVHSKFENARVREKVEEFYTALFEPEPGFYGFCRKYDVKYFVYEPSMLLDRSKESMRYMADRLRLPQDSTAVLMQFAPQRLKHFQLVFQSEAYRLFRVLGGTEQPAAADVPPLPVYDSRRFKKEDLGLL